MQTDTDSEAGPYSRALAANLKALMILIMGAKIATPYNSLRSALENVDNAVEESAAESTFARTVPIAQADDVANLPVRFSDTVGTSVSHAIQSMDPVVGLVMAVCSTNSPSTMQRSVVPHQLKSFDAFSDDSIVKGLVVQQICGWIQQCKADDYLASVLQSLSHKEPTHSTGDLREVRSSAQRPVYTHGSRSQNDLVILPSEISVRQHLEFHQDPSYGNTIASRTPVQGMLGADYPIDRMHGTDSTAVPSLGTRSIPGLNGSYGEAFDGVTQPRIVPKLQMEMDNIGSPRAILALQQCLMEARKSISVQVPAPNGELPIIDRLSTVEFIDAKISYYMLLKWGHLMRLWEDIQHRYVNKTSTGITLDTQQSYQPNLPINIPGNPLTRDKAEIIDQLVKCIYPDPRGSGDDFENKREKAKNNIKLGNYLWQIVQRLGPGMLGLMSCSDSRPRHVISSAKLYSLSYDGFDSFLEALDPHRSNHMLRELSAAVEPMVNDLLDGTFAHSAPYPIEAATCDEILRHKGRTPGLLAMVTGRVSTGAILSLGAIQGRRG